MSANRQSVFCALEGWGLAFVSGGVSGFVFRHSWEWGILAALLGGVVVAIIVGCFMTWFMCTPRRVVVPVVAAPEPEQRVERVEHELIVETEPAPEPFDDAAPLVAKPVLVRVKPTAELPGEIELAARKGSWSYTAPLAASPEPQEQGLRPEALLAPVDGKPDNLQEIKGIGPKLEELCHELGIYHFSQIASWGDAQVAWVDENLQGFRGRVNRDEWVVQAKILAAKEGEAE